MTAEYLDLEPYTGFAVLFRPELGFAPELPVAWKAALGT